MYSGNISKAVIDLIKAIPANHLNIVYENHTGNIILRIIRILITILNFILDAQFVNAFQKYLQVKYIKTSLFNITLPLQQDLVSNIFLIKYIQL